MSIKDNVTISQNQIQAVYTKLDFKVLTQSRVLRMPISIIHMDYSYILLEISSLPNIYTGNDQ